MRSKLTFELQLGRKTGEPVGDARATQLKKKKSKKKEKSDLLLLKEEELLAQDRQKKAKSASPAANLT